MAATSEAPRRGLNLGQPGAKEYLIVGGTALGLALAYFWWKNRQSGAAATTTAAGSSAPATPTGLSTSDFWHWITDHQSSTTTTTPDKDDTKAAKVEVPDVVGEKYRAGAAKVRAAGLIAQRGTPYVGTVRRESPHSGTKVRKGSVITLSGKSGGSGTWPRKAAA